MNRHVKASSAGSTSGYGKSRCLFGLACLCVLGLAAFLGTGTPSARAADAFPGQGFLPNNRAWEMVSPPDKNGGDVLDTASRTRAAADGSALEFASQAGFGDVRGEGITIDYLARRDAKPATNGWSTHAITPGNLEAITFIEQLLSAGLDTSFLAELSPDLRYGAFLSPTPLTVDPDTAKVANLYAADDLLTPGASSYRVLTACPACATTGPLPFKVIGEETKPGFIGGSSDFGHLIFDSTFNLTDDSQGLDSASFKVYEVSQAPAGSAVSLLTRVPASGTECDGGAPTCVPVTESYSVSRGFNADMISRDGSRAYFMAPDADGNGRGVYLRTDSGTPAATTVRIDAAEPVPNPSSPQDGGSFGAATPDGHYVFFTTKQNLVAEDTSDSNLTDLYRYDVEAPVGQRLTLISLPDPGLSADVGGVAGVSDDGSYVYFTSRGQFLSGQPSGGTPRIFVWHEGAIREVGAFLSTEEDRITGEHFGSSPKASRVSADGSRLLFAVRATGNNELDDLPHSSGADTCKSGEGCIEVYLFDAAANGGGGEVECISCTRPDSAAHGDAGFLVRSVSAASVAAHLNHPLSADGRYAFFDTPERLVPEDTNGAIDVYEYDSQTGERRLISSGESKEPSYFMDASLDGKDVFILTSERLSGWDIDNGRDLYDVRAGGGLPEPPPPPASCTGDACQPPPIVPNDPTPGSASFSGPGNPVAKKAKKTNKARKHPHKKRQKQRPNATRRDG